jgi:hypothetical protein
LLLVAGEETGNVQERGSTKRLITLDANDPKRQKQGHIPPLIITAPLASEASPSDDSNATPQAIDDARQLKPIALAHHDGIQGELLVVGGELRWDMLW